MQLRDNKIATGGYRYASKILFLFGPKLLKGANEMIFGGTRRFLREV